MPRIYLNVEQVAAHLDAAKAALYNGDSLTAEDEITAALAAVVSHMQQRPVDVLTVCQEPR